MDDAAILNLLTLTHAPSGRVVRVTDHHEPVESRGNTFMPLPFRIRIDGLFVFAEFDPKPVPELADGDVIRAKIEMVLAERPEDVEFEHEFTAPIRFCRRTWMLQLAVMPLEREIPARAGAPS